jgi:hypothetical protein
MFIDKQYFRRAKPSKLSGYISDLSSEIVVGRAPLLAV